jgi:hypothetical protein
MSGDEIVFEVAKKLYKGNSISAADRLLSDFRKGFLGFGSLEAPIDGQKWPIQGDSDEADEDEEEVDEVRNSRVAGVHRFGKQQEVVKETVVVDAPDSFSGDNEVENSTNIGVDVDSGSTLIGNVGRGKYEGW